MIVNFHSILFSLGALVALVVYRRLTIEMDARPSQTASDILCIFLAGLIGARLSWAIWQGQPFREWFAFWHEGLISWGGLVAGAGAALWLTRQRAERVRWLTAILAAVLIGWTVGRLGNFWQRDAYGILLPGALTWWYGRVPVPLLEAGVTACLGVWLAAQIQQNSWRPMIWAAAIYGWVRVIIDGWRDLPTVLWILNGSQLAALAVAACATLLLWLKHKNRPIISRRPSLRNSAPS